MTHIARWLVCTSSIVGVLVVFLSAASGRPVDHPLAQRLGQSQQLSVQEARTIILSLTKSPANFVEFKDQGEVFDDDSLCCSNRGPSIHELQSINSISISKFRIEIEGSLNKSDIPLKDIDVSERRSRAGIPMACVNQRLCFYTLSAGPSAGRSENERDNKRLQEALLVLKNAALSLPSVEEDEARFQEAARTYRESPKKPELPETARMYRVQAEGAIHDKDFAGAADLYGQALDIAPWWPEGHFNRAIALSGFDDFSDAIVEMKRYIVLAPDAPDARTAQDQIYDWQRKAGTAH